MLSSILFWLRSCRALSPVGDVTYSHGQPLSFTPCHAGRKTKKHREPPHPYPRIGPAPSLSRRSAAKADKTSRSCQPPPIRPNPSKSGLTPLCDPPHSSRLRVCPVQIGRLSDDGRPSFGSVVADCCRSCCRFVAILDVAAQRCSRCCRFSSVYILLPPPPSHRRRCYLFTWTAVVPHPMSCCAKKRSNHQEPPRPYLPTCHPPSRQAEVRLHPLSRWPPQCRGSAVRVNPGESE